MKFFCGALLTTSISSIKYFCFLLVLIGAACGESNMKEVIDKDEVSIKFQHAAKFGNTKIYLTDIDRVPKIPALPNGYKSFQNKVYYLRIETMELGDPIVSFKIPTNSEEVFKNVRILHPVAENLAQIGFEWRDCTVSDDNVWQVPFRDHLPNFSESRVNCHIREGLQPEEYFAVVLQLQSPPKTPFSNLRFDHSVNEHRASAEMASYTLTITNSGQKNIGDLAVFSGFNSELVSIKPSQGKCVRQIQHGSGTAVCFLGSLAVNQNVAINVEASLTSPFLGENMLGWDVEAVIKENQNDPVWPANMFSFDPLGQ